MRRPRAAEFFRCASLVLLACTAAAPRARAQGAESPELSHALELEGAGKNREAAQLFRQALGGPNDIGALLGLERAYAALGITDSLLAPLDTLIARRPREPMYRTVQLRALMMLHRDDALRAAFQRWTQVLPGDPAPYREYARQLLQLGRTQEADSVVQASRRALGGTGRDLAFETAQLRAAQGQWVQSAAAWRDALADAPYLSSAASYALSPTPATLRDSVRVVLRALPVALGARHALADLEMSWGRPAEAWEALRVLPADSASAVVWRELGEQALAEERYSIARRALAAALAVRPSSQLAVLAATAALRGGAPADVFVIAPLGESDSAHARNARDLLPIHVQALAALGRAADAESLVNRYDRWLTPGERRSLSRTLASAWVRAGDLARARAALGAADAESDSSDAAGWLALYEGRLGDARILLRQARDPSPELAFALGVVSRTRGDDAPQLGAAFLALARGDSATAAARFVEAATRHTETAPALLMEAARLDQARGDAAGASALWARIVGDHADAPEAAEAELEWARALRRSGDVAAAVAHLERLILNAPESALLPQARRELDLARAAVPSR